MLPAVVQALLARLPHDFRFHTHTAVLTKVVQKNLKSIRDSAERQSGKYSINFNKQIKSLESILFLLTHANKYS